MMNTLLSIIHNLLVLQISIRSCLQCKARVEPQTPPLGKCTKEDCLMIQLYDLCQEQITVRVMLRHVNNEGDITCSAYGDLVYQLVNIPPLTKSDFLKPQKQHEIQGKNIVTFVLRQLTSRQSLALTLLFACSLSFPFSVYIVKQFPLEICCFTRITSISHSSFTQCSFTVTHTASLGTMLRSCYYLQHKSGHLSTQLPMHIFCRGFCTSVLFIIYDSMTPLG